LIQNVCDFQCIAIGESKSERGGQALKTLHEEYIKCKNNSPEAEEYLAVALIEVFLLLQVTTQKN